MNKYLFYIFLLSSLSVLSQEEASNWYFGENAGIQFANDGSINILNDGQLNTIEGCSSISDDNGDLLFYTDGTTVYNNRHLVMSNGFGLLGDPSSSQSAIVIPKPNDSDIYYIFTVGSNQSFTGLKYSEVDITLDGGLGGITQKNINLLYQCSEKVTAVLKDCTSQAIWVISLSNPNGTSTSQLNTFHAFEVTNAGVNTTSVTSTFNSLGILDLRGYLKLSPDGEKLACANVERDELFLFDFNKDTGIVSNNLRLNINSPYDQPYGIEFSPNSQLLYVSSSNDNFGSTSQNPSSHFSALTQFDLTATNIVASQVLIDQQNLYRSALQLGPNGKIYRSMAATYTQGSPFLSVINNPNEIGQACNYQNNAINLGIHNSTQGLPPFISSFFVEKIDIINNAVTPIATNYLPLCLGENYRLMAVEVPGAIYSWTRNGLPLPNADYFLDINQNGHYEVLIDLNNGGCDFLEGEATIEYFPIPIANSTPKIDICDDNNDGAWAFDLTVQDISILGVQDANHYSVHYFESENDADLNQNEISGLYTNQDNPKEIFARVDLIGSPSCYDKTSFLIEVFNTPTANPVSIQEFCDNNVDGNYSNGQIDIFLHNYDATVLDSQDATAYTITYHPTQTDAENNTAALNEPHYNSTNPFTETVFVRIENNLNTTCYDTTSFNIIINPVPISYNTSLLQCDEDGLNDGRTFFNLNQANHDLTGGAPNTSTVFYTSFMDASDSNSPVNAENFNNTENPQILHVQVIDDITGCFSIAQLSLEVSNTQLLDYQAPYACDNLDSEDGINTFNLADFESDMQTLNGITLPITFYETYQDALLEQNELVSNYNNIIPYNQTLFARAENSNACYGISEVYLSVKTLPSLEEDETVLYCLNTYPQTIPLEAGILNDSPANYTYLWSNGETSGTIQINEIGTYIVTVTNSFGCSQTRQITVEPSNTAAFNDVIVVDANENNTITVLVSGEGEYEYALYNQDGLYISFQESNTFYNVYGGIYSVAVRDIKNNCGIVTQYVSIIGFPKFFTPNGDGYNDTWNIKGVSNVFQPNTMIRIFDRYGQLLKQINPLGEGWDGTFNGDLLPTDDYWFSATLQDGREFKSHFTLKR
ncbi:T9SS type B sorting domain-containing protein [Bizionia arctica]|uniref:T9SS type B sorting domain-containing protein n=1 Tax=Bizionia arctica TaxID=1495645 RepID=A0A917GUJ9_9FLAO|nr:T9SS type B sorting domain-containing protein [Bizionia arctica]GGG57342.1 hypothetical protein GCM10010976_30220 [Bizionia arctica]